MTLRLVRIYDSGNSTLGLLNFGNNQIYTLEDEYREVKVKAETRIPTGKYKIILRDYGGNHEKYKKRFDFHKGMLQLEDVPNFSDILIHIGNTERDTAGCILVGMDTVKLDNGDYKLIQSTKAYELLYKAVIEEMKNQPVYIEIYDEIGKRDV